MRGLVRQHSHHAQFARSASAAAVTEILSGLGPPRLLDDRGGLDPPILPSQLFMVQSLKISPFGLENTGPDLAPQPGSACRPIPGRPPSLRTGERRDTYACPRTSDARIRRSRRNTGRRVRQLRVRYLEEMRPRRRHARSGRGALRGTAIVHLIRSRVCSAAVSR